MPLMVPERLVCLTRKNTALHFWGALVGGPDLDDYHVDETTDYVYNEVAVDFNAAIVGAMAGLYTYYGEGHYPLENFHRSLILL